MSVEQILLLAKRLEREQSLEVVDLIASVLQYLPTRLSVRSRDLQFSQNASLHWKHFLADAVSPSHDLTCQPRSGDLPEDNILQSMLFFRRTGVKGFPIHKHRQVIRLRIG